MWVSLNANRVLDKKKKKKKKKKNSRNFSQNRNSQNKLGQNIKKKQVFGTGEYFSGLKLRAAASSPSPLYTDFYQIFFLNLRNKKKKKKIKKKKKCTVKNLFSV